MFFSRKRVSALQRKIDVANIEKHSIRVGCGTFGVRQVSTGTEPIVFIHGWIHSSLIWDRIPGELADQRSIILIDLPGFGGESLSDLSASLEQVAADLHVVLRQLDSTQAIKTIVADSLGGLLFLLGLNDTKWVRDRQIFLSGIPFDGLPAILRWLPLAWLLPRAIRLIKSLPRFIGRALVNSNIWLTVQLQAAVGDEIYACVLAAEPDAAAHYFQMLQTPMDRTVLVNCLKFAERALLVRGQFDRIVTRETTHQWADIICAEDCDIPGAGHTPMLEAPKYYYKSVATMSC